MVLSKVKLLLDAVQVIRDIIRSPESSEERKRKHFANVTISEVFLEATPTVFLAIMLLVYIIQSKDVEALQALRGANTTEKVHFSMSLFISILSAAFGFAR